ncbi:alpha/beta hydrolase family protein [Nonomuraea endophytica]|uniref:Dipeptidyl aminopeptidase/acylaminoacyl peptidase n=1 Tax=Nonomuraea endophytica TaxID=714136 RepID=A0A7W8EIR6_9ACTN|nr:tannase/feruloyl esterase family alpha/beta hydrolase [Nonomuraea endophytica]MBB5080859.1 dipeptidyl aminopeptidase/acylaminoacyl peptidase [Nonomuraea endophytica]
MHALAALTLLGGMLVATPQLTVPGAERTVTAALADLTTAGTAATGHTDPADWAGLHSAATTNPTGVPGTQIDGYFPDTSTGNKTRGWNHDAQFVIRLPKNWNGGLVVSGTPGNREQYANDFTISDWVLAKGYAFAATDKGNVGLDFHTDGRRPGDAIAEWNHRVTQLTLAAKSVVRQRYGRPPARTLMAGISNGGYLVRWQLENRGHLYDGGVDWEGTLWRLKGDNLLDFLPTALKHGPLRAGFPPESEFLWPFHRQYYWDLTQQLYQKELDPAYTGAPADYVYAERRPYAAVAKIALTGRITKPLITVHGTLDALLPIARSSDVYAEMVGPRRPFRYHRVEGGNHLDALVDAYPDRLRPILPEFRKAFEELEDWVSP